MLLLKNKAVVYGYKISHFINMSVPKIRLNGLDPSKFYRIKDLTPVDKDKPCNLDGKRVCGKLLMDEGLAMKDLLKSEYASLALELQVVE